ncbi:MAG: NADH-quinone oxidoreductase subunit NuoE [Betaproteobacteria bacterium]|nr:NADH-quinone oxidoreductase subunit NuoE [Betaproteobacteria bacterium]
MLSSETLAAIDKEIAKYPPEQRRSAVMSALRLAQVEKGWLSDETMAFVAQYLDMPPIAVREVATFYNMYELAPVGRYKITVCTNLSCSLSGALDIVEHLKKRLNIEVGQTTADGKFTLRAAECMGACGDAPLCTINNHRMEGFLTPETIDRLLSELE